MADDTASTENSKTREFSKIQVEEVEGILFPNLLHNHRSLKDHIHCIRDMPMRDDDVILWAYPKSGTHWLWEVGSMLLAGKAEYEKRTKENVMMEACSMEDLDRLPSPRLLNTHLAASMLPNGVKDGKVKVIYVYRNPKDVLVSRFYHNKQAPSCKDWTLDMMTPMFLSGKFIYGDYFQQLRNADAYMKANPQVPVFKVSFEDMKEDPVGTVERLATFLGVACSAELCRSVAEACSFQRLKEADRTKGLPAHLQPHRIQMYRKGEVGDWKNHMTVAQSELVDAAMTQLQGCDFNIRFTL